MLQVEMSASVRTVTGKGPMRQLRMQGITPGVVYGGGAQARNIQLESKILKAQLLELYRRNAVVTLKVDGEDDKSVMVGEVQTDPVRDTLVHVDFCEIDLNKDRAYNVAVSYQGVAKGVDLGGVMNVVHHEIVIEGKPLDIPDRVVVDVTDLGIGDKVTCGAIEIPGNVRMVTAPEEIAVSIIRPGQTVEEEEGEEEAPEEQEVTGEQETGGEQSE
ncbi:MAG: 50S ribosomal protein L25 [Desulforhopalus sp.]